MQTDLYVPSFPFILQHFRTTPEQVQLILSANFWGLFLSSGFMGPLSDQWGRRTVLLWGLSLSLAASILCVFVNSIEHLIFWRFIQGIGSGAIFVIGFVIIIEVYPPKKTFGLIGIANGVITVAMAGAPLLGAYLETQFGWKGGFIMISLLSLLSLILFYLFIPETSARRKQSFEASVLYKNYKKIIFSPVFSSLMLFAIPLSVYITYTANVSLVFMNTLGYSLFQTSTYQSIPIISFTIISFSMNTLKARFGEQILKMTCLILQVVSAFGIILLEGLGEKNPLYITMFMAIYAGALAIIGPLWMLKGVNYFPGHSGVVSSIHTIFRFGLMGTFTYASGVFFDGTFMPFCVLLSASTLGIITFYFNGGRKVWKTQALKE